MAQFVNPTHGDTAKTGAGQLKAKTESQTLVASNRSRVSVYVANEGASPVWLGLGTDAVAEKGIRLAKEGGGNQPLRIDDFTGEIEAISKEGEPIVSYAEIGK